MPPAPPTFTIYFHRDFDGAGSAAILGDFLAQRRGYPAARLRFRSLGFEVKERWTRLRLRGPCAVLDFLYHPQADWWVDHHVTSFLSSEWREAFVPGPTRVWDLRFPSCCSLMADVLRRAPHRYRNRAFDDLVHWGDIIDAAQFASVEQVLRCEEPALQINLALQLHENPRFLSRLARELMQRSLAEIAALPFVRRAFRYAFERQEHSIAEFRRRSRCARGVVQFDLRRARYPYQRFVPYFLYPEARFVVGRFARNGHQEVSVGSNPWRPFQGPNIGALCARYGGGGREQVGGITLRSSRQAQEAAREISALLRSHAG